MAGITHLKEFQKPALQGIVDETVENAQETFADRYLPNKDTFNSTFAYDLIKSTPHIAAVIGYGAEAPVADRDAVAKMSGELSKMGLKYVVTEEELLAIHNARFDAERLSVIQELAVKGSDLVEAVLRRIYVMKAEALTKGTFSYNKNGVKVNVDFGIPSTQKIVLDNTAGKEYWTNPASKPLNNLIDWVQIYENNNAGQQPVEILVSREVQAALLTHPQITAAFGGTASTVGRIPDTALNTVLAGFGLPPVRVVTDRQVVARNVYTGQDETIEIFPKNRIVMLGEGVGNFLLGPTVENDFRPGISLQAYDKQEPVQSLFKAVAAGFPAIKKPSLIFHADVIAP